MKITLKAHIAEHREIAKMFVGCGVVSEVSEATLVEWRDNCFVIRCRNPLGFWIYQCAQEITIDTSEAKMDLRLAIGTKIRFVEGHDLMDAIVDGVEWNEYDTDLQISLRDKPHGVWIATEPIQLSKDYLERIGVEYED